MAEKAPATKSKGFPLIVLLCIVLVAAIVFGVITYLDKNQLSADKDELSASLEEVNAELADVQEAADQAAVEAAQAEADAAAYAETLEGDLGVLTGRRCGDGRTVDRVWRTAGSDRR